MTHHNISEAIRKVASEIGCLWPAFFMIAAALFAIAAAINHLAEVLKP